MSLSTHTRNAAFEAVAKDLRKNQQIVYRAIKYLGKASNEDLKLFLCWSINLVTGRSSELRDLFLITESGTKKGRCSNYQHVMWRVTTPEERRGLIDKSYASLIDFKDSLVNDYHNDMSFYTRELLDKEINKLNHRIEKLKKL